MFQELFRFLDDIDKKYKDYQIIENFCLGEVFKTYKSSGYEFLKEKYNNKKSRKIRYFISRLSL